MVIEAQFMYRQKSGGEGSIWNTSAKEIKILEVNGTSVHRVGDGKTALQLFLNNNKGTCLNLTKHGIVGEGNNVEFQLFLKLTIRDESGYIGAEDTVDANCIDHDCSYDQYLAELDDLLNDENSHGDHSNSSHMFLDFKEQSQPTFAPRDLSRKSFNHDNSNVEPYVEMTRK